MTWIFLVLVVAALAYANGANDNMKGVATLLGSGTLSYRGALWWGTAATLAGSACALHFAWELVGVFSGRGLVPEALLGDRRLLVAVGSGAASAVFLATCAGLPVSTTHALVGALAGAGLAFASGARLDWGTLASAYAAPLLLSPLLSGALAAAAAIAVRRPPRRAEPAGEACVCVGARTLPTARNPVSTSAVALWIGSAPECVSHSIRPAVALRARTASDVVHLLSAGAVSFARGLNDTPKIAALALASSVAVAPDAVIWLVRFAMAAGAALQARKVGHTMAFRVTAMSPAQGLAANLVTASMVLGASRFGLPVSTTHVSVGALFGLGIPSRGLVRASVRSILLAWLATLPAAFGVACGVGLLLR